MSISEFRSLLENVSQWLKFRGKHAGYWAFLFQRASGVVLVGYLYLHLYELRLLLVGRAAYEGFLRLVLSPVFLPFDIVLFAVGIYHGANGLRTAISEFGYGISHSKALLALMLLVGAIAWAFASYAVAKFALVAP